MTTHDFQRASDYLSPHLKNTDAFLRLHAYWARLELKLGKDLVAARGVWESLLKMWFDQFPFVLLTEYTCKPYSYFLTS